MDNTFLPLLTGTSTTGPIIEDYLYINTTQNTSNLINGSNIRIITLYLQAQEYNTGYINFYNISGRNGDDSNIASGINNETQYLDVLTNTIDSEYPFVEYHGCPFAPYIASGVYVQDTYLETSTGVAKTSVSILAGPRYEDFDISDNVRNIRTQST